MYEGVHIIRLDGRVTHGSDAEYFKAYFKKRIEEGVRFFIVDCSEVFFLDSTGISYFSLVAVRVKMRAGRTVFINSKKLSQLFAITRLDKIVDTAPDLESAFQIIFPKQPTKVPAGLKFEDQFTVTMEGSEGDQKLVVEDKTTHPPQKTEFTIRDIPAPKRILARNAPDAKPIPEIPAPQLLPRTESPQRLSISGMAGVAFGALIFLTLLVVGLVWVSRQVSSLPTLVLIFSVAFLVCFCLLGLLLLLSGHLSEKTVAKLFSGVLGKIPGLSIWMPKVAAKGRTKGS